MYKLHCTELPNNCSTRILTELYFLTREQLAEQLRVELPKKIKGIYDDFKGNGGTVLWSGRADQRQEREKLEACGFKLIYEYKSIHGGKRGMVLYARDHTKENVDLTAIKDIEVDWNAEPDQMEIE